LYKYLGIWLNLELDWTKQEKESVSTLTWLCSKLKYRRLPLHTKIYIINNVFAPSIAYRMNFAQYSRESLSRLQQIVNGTITTHLRTPKKTHRTKLTASRTMGAPQLVDFEHLYIVSYISTFIEHRINPSASSTATTITIEEYGETETLPTLREGLNPPKWNRHNKTLYEPRDSITKFSQLLHHLKWKCTANYTKTSKAIDILRSMPLRPNTQYKANKLAEYGVIDMDIEYSEEARRKWSKEVEQIHTQLKEAMHNRTTLTRPRNTTPNIKTITTDKLEYYTCSKTGKKFALLWTDGSVMRNKAGFGIFTGSKTESVKRRTRNAQTSMQSELEAIEMALQLIPPQINLIIVTDCMSAIQSIESFKHLKSKERRKNIQAFTLARIQHELDKRMLQNATTKLEWVPSHIDDKRTQYEVMEDKETAKKKRDALNKRCEELMAEYTDLFDNIIKGNEIADELAKQGTEERPIPKAEWFPHATTKYYIRKQDGEIVEGRVRQHLRKELQRRADEDLNGHRQKSSNWKDGQIDVTKFAKRASHSLNIRTLQHRQSQETQALDGTNTFRLRAMDRRLPTAANIHTYKHKVTDPTSAKFLQDKYPTPNCQLCETDNEETQNHVFISCPATQEHRNKQQQLIEDALQEKPTKQYIPNISIPARNTTAFETQFSEMEMGIIMLGFIPIETQNHIYEQIEDTEKATQKIHDLHKDLIQMARALWNESRKTIHKKFTSLPQT
jgi:ribonuclease HI